MAIMVMQLLQRIVQDVLAVNVVLSQQYVTTPPGFASVNPMSLEIAVTFASQIPGTLIAVLAVKTVTAHQCHCHLRVMSRLVSVSAQRV